MKEDHKKAETCKCNQSENPESSREEKCKCEHETLDKAEPKEIITEINLDYKDKYLRMLADGENTRKRLQKEKHETIRFAIENTICEFLPALDNFENALKFSQASSDEVKNWASGFQMILTQLKEVMHNHGIVAFHSEGNLFDPHYHEAMEIIETNQHPDGTILEEYAKGYKSQHRTIRPAKVKIAKIPSSEKIEDESLSEEKLEQINPK